MPNHQCHTTAPHSSDKLHQSLIDFFLACLQITQREGELFESINKHNSKTMGFLDENNGSLSFFFTLKELHQLLQEIMIISPQTPYLQFRNTLYNHPTNQILATHDAVISILNNHSNVDFSVYKLGLH